MVKNRSQKNFKNDHKRAAVKLWRAKALSALSGVSLKVWLERTEKSNVQNLVISMFTRMQEVIDQEWK